FGRRSGTRRDWASQREGRGLNLRKQAPREKRRSIVWPACRGRLWGVGITGAAHGIVGLSEKELGQGGAFCIAKGPGGCTRAGAAGRLGRTPTFFSSIAAVGCSEAKNLRADSGTICITLPRRGTRPGGAEWNGSGSGSQ
ncbi:unnamed protein product, partial [Phaeothamnion confervicola]